MRLIDADALIQSVEGNLYVTDSVKSYVRMSVRKMPTIEPKRGMWISDQGLAEVGEVCCSVCKTVYYADSLFDIGEEVNGVGQARLPNYCPHCGCKMDEVEE